MIRNTEATRAGRRAANPAGTRRGEGDIEDGVATFASASRTGQDLVTIGGTTFATSEASWAELRSALLRTGFDLVEARGRLPAGSERVVETASMTRRVHGEENHAMRPRALIPAFRHYPLPENTPGLLNVILDHLGMQTLSVLPDYLGPPGPEQCWLGAGDLAALRMFISRFTTVRIAAWDSMIEASGERHDAWRFIQMAQFCDPAHRYRMEWRDGDYMTCGMTEAAKYMTGKLTPPMERQFGQSLVADILRTARVFCVGTRADRQRQGQGSDSGIVGVTKL